MHSNNFHLFFGPGQFRYPNYFCWAPDIAAVGILNILLEMFVIVTFLRKKNLYEIVDVIICGREGTLILCIKVCRGETKG